MRLGFLFLIFISLCLSVSSLAQDKIHWITMNQLEVAMAKEPKKVLIDVYTNWCGPCKMMMSQTFSNSEIITYVNDNFYAVKFNAEGNEAFTFLGVNYVNKSFNPANANRRNGTHDFTQAIAPVNGRIAYPTLVYLDENSQIISPVQGFWKSREYLPLIHFIGEEVYKSSSSFDSYKSNYYK